MPFVRSIGATIYYEVRGTSGPPIVLIRGFASPIETWNGVDEDLSADHTVIVLDNRGVGRSSCPRGVYRATEMADDAMAVLGDVGIDSAHVLGTSLGGMIAQELALRHPTRVRSLVLGATTAGRGNGRALRPGGVAALSLAVFMPRPIKANLAAWATLSPGARAERLRSMHSAGRPLRRPALPPQPTTLRGLIGQAWAVFSHQVRDRLNDITVPSLIIHGAADNLVDPNHATQLAMRIPTSRLEIWPSVGHDLATESPLLLANTVREHVRKTSQ